MRWPVFRGPLQGYTPEVREVAGAIVTIDRNGEAAIHRGLLREAEAKALRTLEKLRRGFDSTEGESANDEHEDADAPKAASLADGSGWMPAIFKAAGPQDAAQEEGSEQDATEDAEAMADEPAEALAA